MASNSHAHKEPDAGNTAQSTAAAMQARPEATSTAIDGGEGDRQRPGRGQGKNQKRKRNERDAKSGMKNTDWRERNSSKRQRGRDDKATAAAGEQPTPEKRSNFNITFSADEIAAEERRPKRKVAVMIGYAGTGYLGLQVNGADKTIERDIFTAFIAAGAISKANADDPKKSAFTRCARTDKGVHAAGNVLSLKLIVEDEDVVQKINDNLPEQIRVWGIQRTNNAFSCYTACDSRWYEYLLPSYALLPPHPDSFLGKEIARRGKEEGVYDEVLGRLDDIKDYWEEVAETEIRPLLAKLEPDTRTQVLELLHHDDFKESGLKKMDDIEHKGRDVAGKATDATEGSTKGLSTEDNPPGLNQRTISHEAAPSTDAPLLPNEEDTKTSDTENHELPKESSPVEEALKGIRSTYVAAKRRYRITDTRRQKLQAALDMYLGTKNFHNYTIQKSFKDSSSKRHIKSFVVNPEPIQIGDTEWLSLKVHGQSFMMHQIRKMVAMAVMTVRCGAPLDTIGQSFGSRRISIPKAPSLGLLLERPVFDSWNQRAREAFNKAPIDFSNYEKELKEFKDREIYSRMWKDEEELNIFHQFFHQLDNFRTDYFLWATAGGIDASYERLDRTKMMPRELDDESGNEGQNVDEGDG